MIMEKHFNTPFLRVVKKTVRSINVVVQICFWLINL